jgi:hypothetical protein
MDRGAIVLGKCNMGEFALSPDESVGSVYGIVRNPYDLDHSTAGEKGLLCMRLQVCSSSAHTAHSRATLIDDA